MIRLYPSVPIKAQSFEGTKVRVVPNQAMTLREIINRYIRRQAIPGTRNDSYYSIEFGDLEKFRTLDFTEQEERIVEVSKLAQNLLKREKDEYELQKQLAIQKAVESALPPPAPSGAVTGSGGSAQAPPPSKPA